MSNDKCLPTTSIPFLKFRVEGIARKMVGWSEQLLMIQETYEKLNKIEEEKISDYWKKWMFSSENY